jgi:hypothetical protein
MKWFGKENRFYHFSENLIKRLNDMPVVTQELTLYNFYILILIYAAKNDLQLKIQAETDQDINFNVLSV